MIIVFKYRWRLSLTFTPQTKTKSDFIRFRKHWSLGLNFIHTHRVRDGAWDLIHPLNTLYPLSCPLLPRFDCLQPHMFWASVLWARPFAGPCHVPPAVLKHWHLRETEAQKRKDMENLEGLTTVCRPYCVLMLQPVWPPTDREEQKKRTQRNLSAEIRVRTHLLGWMQPGPSADILLGMSVVLFQHRWKPHTEQEMVVW